MSVYIGARFGLPALMIALWVATLVTRVQAQQRGGTAQTDKVQPVNTGANPYRVIRDWATLSLEKRPWGGYGRLIGARPGQPPAASEPKLTRSTFLMSPGRRSGALAAGCLYGRTASMWIARAMCG